MLSVDNASRAKMLLAAKAIITKTVNAETYFMFAILAAVDDYKNTVEFEQ